MGVILTLLFGAVCAVLGATKLKEVLPELDPAEQVGVGGGLILAVFGLVTLFFGFVPGGLTFGPLAAMALVAAPLAGKAVLLIRTGRFKPASLSLWLIPLAVLFLIPLASVLAPSDSRDWDSLAYHLAVPKLWLQQGHIGFVQGIHHSNFPFTADMLYVWGLQWGGQAGAKAFNLVWLVLGCFAVFGLTRRWYPESESAPWIATLALAGCPLVLWEAGTAYIDIPHGLFCGLATLYLADALTKSDRQYWLLTALSLGFAMGTKHTGLQTLAAIVVVGTTAAVFRRGLVKPRHLGLTFGIALLVASPWYIKSLVYTGNPVYPFFYRQLGGKYWNQWRADIYTAEQKSFGVGNSPAKLGHAVFGLAYQPGRYVNPGQDQGRGFPTGSVGFAALLTGLLWAVSGRSGGREKAILGVLAVALLAWFALSQQSRYLTSLVVPLAVLAGGALGRLRLGKVLAVAVALQAAYTVVMLWVTQTQGQLPVVTGQVSREDYQAATLAFYQPARAINQLQGPVRVALYDEVFGYLLDKPYMWANPGHSTLLPNEETEADEYASKMKSLGFTHVYANLQFLDPQARSQWVGAMAGTPYSPEESATMAQDPNLNWRRLVADAVRQGLLRPVQAFPDPANPRSLLFELAR